MKEKKIANPAKGELDKPLPIVDIYTNMFCVDELAEYPTDYFDSSNVTSDNQ